MSYSSVGYSSLSWILDGTRPLEDGMQLDTGQSTFGKTFFRNVGIDRPYHRRSYAHEILAPLS